MISQGVVKEHRKHPCIKNLLLITYVNKQGIEQKIPVSMWRILNIHPLGARIEIYEPVKQNSCMEIDIAVKESELTIKGRVVYVTMASDNKNGLGQ